MPIVPDLDSQRREILLEIERVIERVVRVIVVNAVAELREATPVDTGWARANWVPQVGVPVFRPYGAYPGKGGTAQDGFSERGLAQVAIWRFGHGPVYIVNNVPYIERLNDGSSRQAPAGFVQISIERAIRTTIQALERIYA